MKTERNCGQNTTMKYISIYKLIFVITDGTNFTAQNKILNEYLIQRVNHAIVLSPPQVSKVEELLNPSGIDKNNKTNIVFYNLEFRHIDLSPKINSLGFITRVFGPPKQQRSSKTDRLESEFCCNAQLQIEIGVKPEYLKLIHRSFNIKMPEICTRKLELLAFFH